MANFLFLCGLTYVAMIIAQYSPIEFSYFCVLYISAYVTYKVSLEQLP